MSESDAPHLLIVEARFYDDLADSLLEGAKAALQEAGASWDLVTVPGGAGDSRSDRHGTGWCRRGRHGL